MNVRRTLSRYHLGVNEAAPDLLSYERLLVAEGQVVVGVDEVGRGALAGPLTVGAVVVTDDSPAPEGLTDSKQLTPEEREALVEPLQHWAADWSLGSVSAAEIDRWGLRLALAVAATRAIEGLTLSPTHALLDGPFNLLDAPLTIFNEAPDWPALRFAGMAHTPLIKGDCISATIAAASVLAKVHRDRTMTGLAIEFPTYGWHANKGYAVPAHLAALDEEGPCRYHRLTWRLSS
jgi:ribonuclease HII